MQYEQLCLVEDFISIANVYYDDYLIIFPILGLMPDSDVATLLTYKIKN